jgi:hypothetical protein
MNIVYLGFNKQLWEVEKGLFEGRGILLEENRKILISLVK